MALLMDVKNIATMLLPLLITIAAVLLYKTLIHQKFWDVDCDECGDNGGCFVVSKLLYHIRVLASLSESIPLWQWSALIAMIGEPRQNIYATICNAVPLVGFSCSFLITPLMKGHWFNTRPCCVCVSYTASNNMWKWTRPCSFIASGIILCCLSQNLFHRRVLDHDQANGNRATVNATNAGHLFNAGRF